MEPCQLTATEAASPASYVLTDSRCRAFDKPLGRGPEGLPVGIQVVAPRMTGMRLLSIAKALAPVIDMDTKAASREPWN